MTILKGNELATYQRDDVIWQMRLEGHSLRQIGEAVKLSHVQVMNIINARLAEMVLPNLEEHIKLEVERIETAIQSIFPKVRAGDVQAVTAFIRLSERKARLLGLDAAPKPVQVMIDQNHRFAWDNVYDAVAVVVDNTKMIDGKVVENE